MKYKSENEIFEELLESIFSGNVDGDKPKEDESEENDDSTDDSTEESKDSGKEEEEEEKESNESEESNDNDDEDDEDDGDEDSDEGDSTPDFGGEGSDGKANGPFTSKIRTLQKQYNDLLIDAFEKYAPECIEDALDETKSAFGENIEDILQNALDRLKSKIMGDLGVEGSSDMEGMMPPSSMGSFDPAAGADTPMEISIEKGE